MLFTLTHENSRENKASFPETPQNYVTPFGSFKA